jgi:hypothetical protein
MSYLDLGEIYLLLYAEITINVTLKEAEIRRPIYEYRQGSFTLCAAAFQLTFGSLSPTLPLPRKEHRSSVCSVAKPFSFAAEWITPLIRLTHQPGSLPGVLRDLAVRETVSWEELGT